MLTRQLILPIALAVTFGISGCDYYNGVTRSYSLQSTIEYSCVESVLETHPQVAEFRYSIEGGSRELTWSGVQKPDQIHRFSYQLTGTDYWPNFYFVERYDGVIEYRHSLGCLNCTPPQEDVDLVRPFMKSIERRLEDSCGLTGISASTEEHCVRVDCADIE